MHGSTRRAVGKIWPSRLNLPKTRLSGSRTSYNDPNMTLGMEFHDARLLDLICRSDGSGHALFHACIYRSEGVVFIDPQESGWQNCRLTFQGMRVEGTSVEPGEYSSGGSLWVDGKIHDDVVLLPLDHDGAIQVHLVMSPLFETLKIHAEKVSSTLEGPWELERVWSLEEMT